MYVGCSVLWRRLFTCSQGTKLGTIDVFQFLFQTHALVHLQAHTLFDSHSYKRAHTRTYIYIVIHAHKCASTQPSSPLRSYHVHFSTLTLAHMLSERLLYSQQTPKQNHTVLGLCFHHIAGNVTKDHITKVEPYVNLINQFQNFMYKNHHQCQACQQTLL